MQLVEGFESKNGRTPKRVNHDGVGYDLLSKNLDEERHIEVKGVSELWKTYTWQSLHHTEVSALNDNPHCFFLYIVHFEIQKENRDELNLNVAPYSLYILPGNKMLSDEFKIQRASFALSPISKKRLLGYLENKSDVGNSVGQSENGS